MADDRSVTVWVMSATQVREARTRLGYLWGLNRGATPSELAEALGLGGRDPGGIILKWERDVSRPSGPCSRLLQALLEGFSREHGGPDAPEVRTVLGPRD